MTIKSSITELETSTRELLLSMVDILAAGGPPFFEAVSSLSSLLRSKPLLDPENISRHAFHLADQRDAIFRKISRLHDEENLNGEAGAPWVKPEQEFLPSEISALLISMINHVVSLRPSYYQEIVAALIKQVETGSQLAQILSGFLNLIIQLREDLWEERAQAFKHIEDILAVLEDTEKDFISSINSSQSHIIKTDQEFISAMETDLHGMNSLVSSTGSYYDFDQLFQKLSVKITHLLSRIQQKKLFDSTRLRALEDEKHSIEKRLNQSRRDYDDFLRKSHEMLKEMETLKAVSLHDPLTEIYNRRAYDNQISKTMAALKDKELKTCSMIVFDIDNFKNFNNIYGHLAGDRILAYVARITRDTLRSNDLIFRYGGDEFVILMPNADINAARVVADKVRLNIISVEFKLFKNSDITARLTVSMGVTEIRPEDDATTFFDRADNAMYLSKNKGRNCITNHLG